MKSSILIPLPTARGSAPLRYPSGADFLGTPETKGTPAVCVTSRSSPSKCVLSHD
jgi:hypothetical protein